MIWCSAIMVIMMIIVIMIVMQNMLVYNDKTSLILSLNSVCDVLNMTKIKQNVFMYCLKFAEYDIK